MSKLTKYITSEDFETTLALIDLSISVPEFDIHTVSHTVSMEALVLLRGKGGTTRLLPSSGPILAGSNR